MSPFKKQDFFLIKKSMNQGIVILIMQEVKKLMTTQLRKLG